MGKRFLTALFLIQLTYLSVECTDCGMCAVEAKAKAPLSGICFSESKVDKCPVCQAYMSINITEKLVKFWRTCSQSLGKDYNGVYKDQTVLIKYSKKDYGNCGTPREMFSTNNLHGNDLKRYNKLIIGWDKPACGGNLKKNNAKKGQGDVDKEDEEERKITTQSRKGKQTTKRRQLHDDDNEADEPRKRKNEDIKKKTKGKKGRKSSK